MASILTLFPNPLCVLRALCGFIFINRRVRRDRKDFCNGVQLKAIYLLSIGLQFFYFFFAKTCRLNDFCDGIAELF